MHRGLEFKLLRTLVRRYSRADKLVDRWQAIASGVVGGFLGAALSPVEQVAVVADAYNDRPVVPGGSRRGLKSRLRPTRFLSHAGFVHVFTRGELTALATATGRALVWEGMSGDYPHATLTPSRDTG